VNIKKKFIVAVI